MSADPNPTMRADLVTARDALLPAIRGLHKLAAVFTASSDADLLSQVNTQIMTYERRRDLIVAKLVTLDAVVTAGNTLEADGFPTTLTAPLVGSLFSQIQEENADLEAGMAVFSPELTVAVNQAAAFTDKPQPIPPQA
jgi:hypothetical protein